MIALNILNLMMISAGDVRLTLSVVSMVAKAVLYSLLRAVWKVMPPYRSFWYSA